MELYTGSLYWPGTSPYYYMYPKLERSVVTEAVVIGTGIAGMLCGYLLSKSGIETIAVDAGDVGGGAVSADPGVVQYASGLMLSDLIDQLGERTAVRLYAACRHAVEHLSVIAGGLGRDVGFKRRSSLHYASGDRQVNRLEREFRALRTYGFDVEYWSASDIRSHFPFTRPGAIITHGDAELNPFLFVHETASAGIAAGLQVYEQTEIEAHEWKDGRHRLTARNGVVIEANIVIYATGSAPVDVCESRMQTLMSRNYAIVTDRQAGLSDWHQRFILRDATLPFVTMRTTQEGRIVASGLRELADGPLPGREARQKYVRELQGALREMFPDFDSSPTHEWCVAAGESRDRLPYIGEDPDRPGVYYSLGCGGNGLVFAMLAAQIIRDRLQGERHPVADLLRLGRPVPVSVI